MREAGRRTIDMRHFDVQLLGGIAMFHKSIVEMQTGEGKTLAATLPMYLNALVGKGCHLATVNDYLARRDAEWMGPIYQALGLTVGVVETQMSQDERRKAYHCDVTYGTAKEFGFDFLRDRLLLRRIAEGQGDLLGGMLGQRSESSEKPVQGPAYFALVDEADSILIDEARTPLIISALPTEEEKLEAECYKWSASVADEFVDEDDYDFDHEKKTVELTREGRQKVRLLPKPEALDTVGMVNIYRYIERAILVAAGIQARPAVRGPRRRGGDRRRVHRPAGRGPQVARRHPPGGRGQAGRRGDRRHRPGRPHHRPGLLPALRAAGRHDRHGHGLGPRAAEDLPLPRAAHSHQPAGHPPAAADAGLRHRARPSGRPWSRRSAGCTSKGRPVLIGTRSIDKSEHLSRMLDERGIEHQVLNANHIAAEAEIVAQAGQRGKVTVSTNMAGRGTDIKLGEGIAKLGGLHVILTEMHDAARIDRQLIGRCGRQGDPGTFRQYLALDDDLLLAGLGPKKADKLMDRGERLPGPFDHLSPLFLRAQRKVERRHFRQRRALMYFEKERKKMQRQMGQDPYLDTAGG